MVGEVARCEKICFGDLERLAAPTALRSHPVSGDGGASADALGHGGAPDGDGANVKAAGTDHGGGIVKA